MANVKRGLGKSFGQIFGEEKVEKVDGMIEDCVDTVNAFAITAMVVSIDKINTSSI